MWFASCSHLQQLEACRAAWQQTMQAELDEQRRAIEEAEAASQASLEARQVHTASVLSTSSPLPIAVPQQCSQWHEWMLSTWVL